MITVDVLKKEATELQSELAQFEQKRRRLILIRELIATYGGESGENGHRAQAGGESPPSKRFSLMGTTDAIKAFLAEKPVEFFSPRDIGKGLLEGGHRSVSPNFFNIVYTICKRKAETGEFQMVSRDGKNVFRLTRFPP
jgi:hypothetical protein